MPIESSFSLRYEALVPMVWPLRSSLPILTILAFFIERIGVFRLAVALLVSSIVLR